MRHKKNPFVLLLVFSIFILSSCAHKNSSKLQIPEQAAEIQGPPLPPTAEQMGPFVAPPEQVRPADVGPQPLPATAATSTPPNPEVLPTPTPTTTPLAAFASPFTFAPDGYVIVLGPGLARGLSHIGALRVFEEHGLKINAIVGVEMGALIGSIWASANLNHLEWEMHKFKQETLFDYPLFNLKGKIAKGNRLKDFISKAVIVDAQEKMHVPVFVASTAMLETGDHIIFDRTGSPSEILRGAVSLPGFMEPYFYNQSIRSSAASEMPYPVTYAKNLGAGKVICVDALGKGGDFKSSDLTEQQLGTVMRTVAIVAEKLLPSCDFVVSVQNQGIGVLSFDAKAELIYRGKVAALQVLEKIQEKASAAPAPLPTATPSALPLLPMLQLQPSQPPSKDEKK